LACQTGPGPWARPPEAPGARRAAIANMDRVVVITGASSGMGRATAHEFARRGASIVLVARSADALEATAAECVYRGARAAVAVAADVTHTDAMERVVRETRERFGRIDVWINNASVGLFASFEESPPDIFRAVMETNFFGYLNGARAVLPLYREQKRGTLINVVSLVAKAPQPYLSAYVASKFAVLGWAESLRMELLLEGNHDIHICTLHPPSVDTPFFQHSANYTGREPKPIRPIYTAPRVAKAIVSLAVRPRREVVVGRIARALTMTRTITKAGYESVEARYAARDFFTRREASHTEGSVFAPRGRHAISGGWRRTSSKQRMALLAAAAVFAGLLLGASATPYRTVR
jgi:short-subunit dehydrogenase